jgi:hypothetical protein
MKTYTLNSQRAFRPQRPTRNGGPLSREQKARLSIEFKEAWDQNGRCDEDGHDISADDYRRHWVQEATGKAGLTACTGDDYLLCLAKAKELKGETGEAVNAHMAHATEDKRIAFHAVTGALKGRPLAYAEGIARRMFRGLTLGELSAKQLYSVQYALIGHSKK